ncbi:hypothetical protein TcWFU_001750 [Taenia crassiceps]|uniref:Dynein regulatory complex protein 10 n=1 Tax=Taenia crassiceps TaxID=6207 RepID=A0ABR4QPE6_9CEST
MTTNKFKIKEMDEFLKTKNMFADLMKKTSHFGFNQLTESGSIDKLIDRHVLNARKMSRFLAAHPDVANDLLTKSGLESNEAIYKMNEHSVKGLKNIRRKINEGKLICRELRLNIESHRKEYNAVKQQTESKVKALDSRIRFMQWDLADLKEKFTDSTLKIASKGVESYEDAIKQSQIRQKHLKSVLTLAEGRVDEEIKAIQKEVKENWSRKFKLESTIESQTASYDEEMIALQERYDELERTFDNEKEQIEEYQKRMATLWIEHEEMLTQEEAERERQRAADARDAAVTEACRVIDAYARAFLARRAAVTATTSRRRRRERR